MSLTLRSLCIAPLFFASVGLLTAACGSTSLPSPSEGGESEADASEVSSEADAEGEEDATNASDVAELGGQDGASPSEGADTSEGLVDASGPEDSSTPAPDAEGSDKDSSLSPPDTATPDEGDAGPDGGDDEPLCTAGEVSCDGDWVVVCAPGGESYTQIIECQADEACFEGSCCAPDCEGKVCGDDGCGGSCGACASGESCSEGVCVCAPDCEGKACGGDGCGGNCGECGAGELCTEGACVCVPECGGAMCGDDGCGGSCGACPADNLCEEGVCVGPCTPGDTRCNAGSVEVCNPDGESWTAVATCAEDTPCFEGTCCTPVCGDAECGSDGCGGSCGGCAEGDICKEGACLPGCEAPGVTSCEGYAVTLCSPEGIAELLIDCEALDQICQDGECIEPVLPPAECPETCSGESVEAALCALDICYEDFLVSAEFSSPTGDDMSGTWAALEHYGSLDNDLWPQAAPSYLLLSTGLIDNEDNSTGVSGGSSVDDPFSDDGLQIHDAHELKLTLTAPLGVSGFAIDSLFMSMEYEEWIGSNFNDKFYLIVASESATAGVEKVINYAACSNPEVYFDFENEAGKWCYIAINAAYSEPCDAWTTDLSGTGYSCPDGSSTGWLRTTHPITAGETFTLTLHIHDTSDEIYDSAALIDNFQWLSGEVIHETVPIAAIPCATSCEGKSCGDDGCGGSCGTCDAGELCSAAGLCTSDEELCGGPNPEGCSPESPCATGDLCVDAPEGTCLPSSCTCGPDSEAWECTEDCGGGVCVPAEETSAIVVELTWETPADPDETNTGPEAGSDLDLHFAHPNALASDDVPWMNQPWDCFWFNPSPNWGQLDSSEDDPQMLLDDTDGAGPEIIALPLPEDDTLYRVGVHYWNDHDYGESLARVRIWIAGQLAAEFPAADEPGISLEKGDLWSVATIHWPTGEVTLLSDDEEGEEPIILEDFEAPGFPSP